LTHDFERYGLVLEADWSEIPIRFQRSGGIPMFDLTCDALRLLCQVPLPDGSPRVKADSAMITKSHAGRDDATN
jgi:hypothetical protein